MRPQLCIAAFSLALALAPSLAIAQRSAGIPVGHVFETDHKKMINGWGAAIILGHYERRSSRNLVTTETIACCYAVFEKGARYLVARTEPVLRHAGGGVKTQRVLATTVISKRAAREEERDCHLLWITPALSLYDPKTDTVRSVIVTDDGFRTVTWLNPGNYCSVVD